MLSLTIRTMQHPASYYSRILLLNPLLWDSRKQLSNLAQGNVKQILGNLCRKWTVSNPVWYSRQHIIKPNHHVYPFFLCTLVPEASTLSSPGQAVECITIGGMRKPSLCLLPLHPCCLSSAFQYLLLNKMQHSIKTQNTEIMNCKNLPGAKCVLLRYQKRSTGAWSLHLLLSNEKESKENSTTTRRLS